MKKITLIALTGLALSSCGGYTEEQGKAADAMCDCMEKDTYGDFDINWFECDAQMNEKFDPAVFEEGSWIEALEEKCPDVASKME